MKKGRMVISRGTLSLMWLFICFVLLSVPPAQGQNYVSYPTNTTVNMGKSTTFTCAVQPGNTTMNFTARLPLNTYTLQCPGSNINLPSMSLYGTCDYSATQITATWKMSNIATDVNGTTFTCSPGGLPVQTGYLWITGASQYFLMLFGCVMGGFFGILIVFSVTYVSMKRSEKFQECFKGKPEDDVMGGVEEESIRD
ncbi:uncharacterized protein Hap1MRO34_001064 [Clarias gariepinus]